MHHSLRTRYSAYWKSLQSELLPQQAVDLGGTSPTLERIIRVLEWVRIEEYVGKDAGFGRPPAERGYLARAFCAKALLNMECTTELIERLEIDSKLRRICGFSLWRKLPSEATFSRAFAEFAKDGLAEKAHAALIRETLGERIIGAVSRDSTAIVAREKPRCAAKPKAEPQPKKACKRGRPAKGEARPAPEPTQLQRQRTQSLEQIVAELPKYCNVGTKTNAKGYKESWNGYKLHLDTTDCGVTVSAITTAASVHDSQVGIALSRKSEQRITFLYELADAAYCSTQLREDSIARGHVPLFEHNPRGGEKQNFEPCEAQRYKARTGAERANAELKDNYGARQTWVRGGAKVDAHLMFGVLCLSAEQIMRLLQ